MTSERQRLLKHVTLEEYIEANGGMESFVEAINTFAKENGFDWKRQCEDMMQDVDNRAALYRRMGIL